MSTGNPLRRAVLVTTLFGLVIGTLLFWRQSRGLEAETPRQVSTAQQPPSAPQRQPVARGGVRVGASAADIQMRVLSAREMLSGDQRQMALSREEALWMRRHGYPTAAEMDSLDTLETGPLRGTRDPQLATLHGMALARRNELMPAMTVLDGAAALGSTFAYEEAAIAEYRLVRERFGPSIDSDDVLRARLEVARILGDYKVDYLIGRYLPNYPLRDRASIVQAHTTTFLRKLGEETQLRGVPPRGPDPRPNSEAWLKLRAEAAADSGRTVEVFFLE